MIYVFSPDIAPITAAHPLQWPLSAVFLLATSPGYQEDGLRRAQNALRSTAPTMGAER